MAVNVELAINLIQAANLQVITSVYGTLDGTHAPPVDGTLTVLDTGNLPYVVTIPASASFWNKGGGWIVNDQTMTIICFVEPLGQNDLPSRYAEAVRLYQAMLTNWVTASQIPIAYPTDNPGGYQIIAHSGQNTPHSSDGLVPDLSFGGKPFHGFRIHLNVQIMYKPS